MHEPLVEHRLSLGGVRTRALELEGEGPPLVLLHGFADSADTWRRVLDLLGRRGRRALAVDLPGYGQADPLEPDGSVLDQYRAFARAAVAYAHEQGDDEVILAGNSLGGAVALRVAEDPDLPLAAVVPIAPAGLDMPRWFGLIERDPFVRMLLAAPVPLPAPLVRAVVGQAYRTLAFAAPRAAAAEVVDSFTSHLRSRAAVRQVLANGRRLLPELTLDAFALAAIDVPVLMIWGDRDRMVAHAGSRHVLDALPGTTYILLAGVGHCPQVEAPERLLAALDEFTIRHTSRRP